MPRGTPKDPETARAKMAAAQRERWKDPDVRARRVAGMSAATKGKKVISDEQRVAISQKLTGRKRTDEERRNISKGVEKRWIEGKWANRRLLGAPSEEKRLRIAQSLKGHEVTPETRQKLSASSRANWQNPDYRKKALEARQMSPNKLEQSLIPTMESLGFRYTGNGSFWVHDPTGSHNPDFKQTGKRRVVEIWGNYWHRDQDPQEAIQWYATHGFQCLVIWESDLTDQPIEELVARWLTDGVLSDDLEGRTYGST